MPANHTSFPATFAIWSFAKLSEDQSKYKQKHSNICNINFSRTPWYFQYLSKFCFPGNFSGITKNLREFPNSGNEHFCSRKFKPTLSEKLCLFPWHFTSVRREKCLQFLRYIRACESFYMMNNELSSPSSKIMQKVAKMRWTMRVCNDFCFSGSSVFHNSVSKCSLLK